MFTKAVITRLFLSIFACASLVLAQEPADAPASRKNGPAATSQRADLAQKIASLTASCEKACGASIGVSAVDLRSGKTIAAVRPDVLFAPASCQKLLTGAFILARRGGNFRFTTSVYLYKGRLYVKGSFDPTLGDPRLARSAGLSIYHDPNVWARAIKAAVGTKFKGDLIVEGRPDVRTYRQADWPTAQYRRWYAAPIAPLNFYDNCFSATFTVQGGRVEAHVLPASRFIRMISRIKPGRRHLWSLRTSANDSVVTLRGTVSTSTRDPLFVALDDPPLLLGRVLADRIVEAGVKFAGQIRSGEIPSAALRKGKKLAETRTDLAVVMKRANKRSLNMMAEGMFLQAGDGTWTGSAKIMTKALIEKFSLGAKEFVVRDGGGLSHRNRISPSALTRVLSGVAKRRDAGVFLRSLPISGTDGTMRRRLRKAPYRGRVLGKTGYITGVSCLSGYVLDRQGRPAVAFAILTNGVRSGRGWKAKQYQNAICRLLVDELDRGK